MREAGRCGATAAELGEARNSGEMREMQRRRGSWEKRAWAPVFKGAGKEVALEKGQRRGGGGGCPRWARRRRGVARDSVPSSGTRRARLWAGWAVAWRAGPWPGELGRPGPVGPEIFF